MLAPVGRLALWAFLGTAGCLQAAVVLYEQDFENVAVNTQLHTIPGWGWTGGGFIGRVSEAAAFTGDHGVDVTRNPNTGSNISGDLARYWVSSGQGAFDAITDPRRTITASFAVRAVDWVAGAQLNFYANDHTGVGFGLTANRLLRARLDSTGTLTYWDGPVVGGTVAATGITVSDWNVIGFQIDLGHQVNRLLLNGQQVGDDFAYNSNDANSIFTGIRFEERNNGELFGGIHLDDVTITMSPIPEPGTLVMVALGVLSILLVRSLPQNRSRTSSSPAT